ncbi:MAG: hypothetical protein Q8L88_03525 [Bacteroidota bacterium]|nr:hypothetical protein [Bacteroidota bacterium]
MKYRMILVIILSFTITSCMHTMMMGGHDDHNEHQATTITKEVINGDYTLSVTIEPMTIGKEGNITLSLRSKSGVPESVAVHYMISKSSAVETSSKHDHGGHTKSNEEFKTIHQNITMMKGTSAIAYTPTAAGSFVLTVEIEKFPGSDASLSVEAAFMVHEKKSSGMMGMGGMMGMSSEYWYLGAAAMAGMMVVMWTVRGGIF